MRCTFCGGSGTTDWPALVSRRVHNVAVPCPECGGSGHMHCCEGLQEQADDAVSPNTRRGDGCAE